jgi:peptidoglycan hydrolase-like protein with peptidoglycan-binding domain
MRHRLENVKVARNVGSALFEGKDVASEEDKKQQSDGKGFAGLSSMVSDVDATVASTPKQQQREASSSSTHQSSPAARPERQVQQRATQQTNQAPEQPSGVSSAGKWLFGIVAVFGVIWLANQSDNNSPSRSTNSSAPSSTTVVPSSTSQPPVVQPQAPSRAVEDQPSIGRNNVLSVAQIRYCLAEKIRLDAAESVINNYVDSDVERFNGYVNDYNSRCGEFRYRQGTLESAGRDVEPYRSQLQAEGRSRFVSSPLVETRSATPAQSQIPAQTPQPVRPSPDSTVLAIQQLLNGLGYDAGSVDGLFGNKTRLAILAYQRDSGLAADGLADRSLLRQLELSEGAQRRENSVAATHLPVISNPSQPSLPQNSTPGVSDGEKAAIERACNSARQYSGPSAYQSCLNRELASLLSSGGSPDLSFATSEERAAIESACDSARQYSGPGAYYNCLNREISSLRSSRGRPDLAGTTASEREAIERACDGARQYSGPGDYYNCLNRELSSLRSTGGRPNLSSASTQEQAAIERACDGARQYSGPGDYYDCLNRELSSLRSTGGRPNLSSASTQEQAAIERACDGARQYSGPGDYYNCLRRELSKMGYR